LSHPDDARELAATGRKTALENFAWPSIAAATAAVYRAAGTALPRPVQDVAAALQPEPTAP